MLIKSSNHQIPPARKVILSAILIASIVVLSRFLAIRTPILSISFYFVPTMFAGMLLGWPMATFIAVIADLIGGILFPSGPFFIGYTLTAALTGFVAGICLYRPDGIKVNRNFIIRLVICVLISTAILQGGLNTLWIFITTGGASNIIVPVRIAKQLIMVPVELIMMTTLTKIFASRFNQLAFSETTNTSDHQEHDQTAEI